MQRGHTMSKMERLLRNTKVLRKGDTESVNSFGRTHNPVFLHSGYTDSEDRQLWLRFDASASGGSTVKPATTNYRVLIDTGDYAAILKAMCDVDQDVALSVMADEMAARLKKTA